MEQSGVALMDHDKGKEATDWRTSTTYFMSTMVKRAQPRATREVMHLITIVTSQLVIWF